MTSSTDSYSSLTTSPRIEDLRDRHLEYYADLAVKGDAELYGPDVAAWHRLLDSEYDNFTQALDRTTETGQESAALCIVNIIYWINDWRGDTAPAGPWLEKALAVGATASGGRAQALLHLATVAVNDRNDRRAGFQLAEKALAVAQEATDKRFEAWALRRLGTTFVHEVGGAEGATALLEQSLEAARQTGSEHEEAHSLHLLAWRMSREDPEGSRRDLQKSLDIYRRVGDIWKAAWMVYGMAWAEHDPVKAQDLAEEALKMARDQDDQTMIICVLDMMGWLAHGRGEFDEALETFEKALEEFRQPGRKWPLWWAVTLQLGSASIIDVQKGQFEKARARNEEELQIALEHESLSTISMAKIRLARVIAFQGDHAKAVELAEEAVSLARDAGSMTRLGLALVHLGEICLYNGDLSRAKVAYDEALSIRRDEIAFAPLPSLRALAGVAIAEGKLDEARILLEEALDLAHKSSSVSMVHVIQTTLAKVARLKGEFDEADTLSATALNALVAKGHLPFLASALEERAALASARSETERAAKIFGSAAALRERIGVPVYPLNRSDFETEVGKVETALGSEAFQKAFDEGRGLELEEAIKFAL